MKREIKFRHYLPSTNVMTAGHHPHTLILTSDGKEEFWKDAVWLEYTGFKDVNGKEIFDGDIVEANDGYYTARHKHRVFWNHAYAAFHHEKIYPQNSKLNHEEALFHLLSRKPEVVGNIYQNPDLLK